MDIAALEGILSFIKSAENLKNTLRFSFTSAGRHESTAEHSWRLCLLVMICSRYCVEAQPEKLLKLALIHDLAEAVCGDVPAIQKEEHGTKYSREKAAMSTITRSLPEEFRAELLALWEEYEEASTEEAKIVKALDKIETLLQHSQGKNPSDFNYAFNMTYGKECTDAVPFISELRKLIDIETERRITDFEI